MSQHELVYTISLRIASVFFILFWGIIVCGKPRLTRRMILLLLIYMCCCICRHKTPGTIVSDRPGFWFRLKSVFVKNVGIIKECYLCDIVLHHVRCIACLLCLARELFCGISRNCSLADLHCLFVTDRTLCGLLRLCVLRLRLCVLWLRLCVLRLRCCLRLRLRI